MKTLATLLDAWDERIGWRRAWRLLAEEEIPGGARWAYVFGSALVTLVGLQLASGVVLALDYAPTTDSAHESVSRLMDPEQAPWGALVRSLHHHGASFMVLALVAHALQVVWFGAYRRPREANWLTGLGLGLVVLGFAFTGYLLPWDQTAYYATRVGLNIMRSVPLVGGLQADLLQGGPVLGNLTLTRFYALHVLVLPALLLGLLGVHLYLFRRHGVTPPASLDGDGASRAERFWPVQALRDVVVALLVVATLLAAAAWLPAPLGAKADPSVPFDAMPEWYFYWLFQLLHYFEPPVEWIGSLLVPAGLLTFLAALPWLDRAPTRQWRQRRAILATTGLLVAALAGLTLQVALGRDSDGIEHEGPPEVAPSVAGAPGPTDRAAQRSAMLYGLHCTECHGLDGEPIDEDATDFRTEDLARMGRADFGALLEHVLLGGEMMPAFDEDLTEEQARRILIDVVLRFPESAREER